MKRGLSSRKNPRSGGLGFHQCRLSPKVALHWGELGCHSGQLPISLVRGLEITVYNNITAARKLFLGEKKPPGWAAFGIGYRLLVRLALSNQVWASGAVGK